MAWARKDILERLRDEVQSGRPLLGAGAGCGLSAKCAERGGVDLLILYNSGRFRMAGWGSLAGMLPFGDANAIVAEMGAEILNVVEKTPVLAGVCGTDPSRDMRRLLVQLQEMGFSGVQNFPSVGLHDGRFRENLEETGFGYGREVEMIRTARELGLFSAPHVFCEDEARSMAEAGADLIVAHLGLTTKGTIGAKTALDLKDAPGRVQAMRDAAVAVNPDILCLCHGGPIAEPEDARFVLTNTQGVAGFFGASSIERLPVETAITERTGQFKSLTL